MTLPKIRQKTVLLSALQFIVILLLVLRNKAPLGVLTHICFQLKALI